MLPLTLMGILDKEDDVVLAKLQDNLRSAAKLAHERGDVSTSDHYYLLALQVRVLRTLRHDADRLVDELERAS